MGARFEVFVALKYDGRLTGGVECRRVRETVCRCRPRSSFGWILQSATIPWRYLPLCARGSGMETTSVSFAYREFHSHIRLSRLSTLSYLPSCRFADHLPRAEENDAYAKTMVGYRSSSRPSTGTTVGTVSQCFVVFAQPLRFAFVKLFGICRTMWWWQNTPHPVSLLVLVVFPFPFILKSLSYTIATWVSPVLAPSCPSTERSRPSTTLDTSIRRPMDTAMAYRLEMATTMICPFNAQLTRQSENW